ncbi:repetitive organellar protein-like [Onthophagus taurus]|uniref:repetitive organellar protein-like n=1 Tax=Onthophagus taurus TaxID=166361 RepID=UPI000C200694|nr:uncharacterized protein LOC111424940 [Onthophagus taurus]
MGTEASKIQEDVKEEIVPEGSVPSTPILTPKTNLIRDLDPRSPSNNVVRTPIETIMLKHKSSLDGVLSAVQYAPRLKYLNVDPRSPTVDFNRTPILVEDTEEKLDEICDKKKSFEANKRKSGLLETNLDYVETDIDVAFKEKSPLKLNMVKEINVSIQEKEIIEIEKEVDEIKLEEEEIKDIVDNDLQESENDLIPKIETLPKDLTVVMNTVKDFDKKLMNLIYEDEETEDVNKKEDNGLRLTNRTPLAARNINVETKKLPKLKVADKPKKLNNRLSKIPISKVNTKNKFGIQCENTPPGALREHERKGKSKKFDWDGDKTLVI